MGDRRWGGIPPHAMLEWVTRGGRSLPYSTPRESGTAYFLVRVIRRTQEEGIIPTTKPVSEPKRLPTTAPVALKHCKVSRGSRSVLSVTVMVVLLGIDAFQIGFGASYRCDHA
jgi:hypothetical protein